LLRLPEGRAGGQLGGAADVVQERGREEQVAAQALMQLSGLAADGRDADGGLQQSARVGVVRLGGRQPSERPADRLGVEEAKDGRTQSRMRDLRREELEEAFELVRVPSDRRRELGGVSVRRSLE